MGNVTLAAKPFIRWAGGKTYLLPEIKKRIPSTWNPETDLYVEPFLGAGALFWDLKAKRTILNDANEALMLTYQAVRDHVEALIVALQKHEQAYRHRDAELYYYEVRAQDFGWARLVEHAARFIFLNKTCFNGLYRVSVQGKFNVPWGKDPFRVACDPDLIRACSEALHEIYLEHGDFTYPTFKARDALIYCDPPYVPISKTSNFTSYTADGFSYYDQLRLAVWAANLRDAGAHVILSQAAYEPLIDQYRHLGFTCDLVQVPRRVNSKGAGRGNVGEYIIY